MTFTTTQQTDYTIDCSLGEPININYCYTNSDTTYWLLLYERIPSKIEFNSGTIEGFGMILQFMMALIIHSVLSNNNDADIHIL